MSDSGLDNLQLLAQLIHKMEDSKDIHDVQQLGQSIFAFQGLCGLDSEGGDHAFHAPGTDALHCKDILPIQYQDNSFCTSKCGIGSLISWFNETYCKDKLPSHHNLSSELTCWEAKTFLYCLNHLLFNFICRFSKWPNNIYGKMKDQSIFDEFLGEKKI